MGRRSSNRALGLWMNGLFVGEWRIPARGAMELRYDADWIKSPQGRPLSLSLPFNMDGLPLKGDKVEFYFENLLPDSDAIRKRLQSRFGTRSRDAFDLLAAVGRDCVGALQLLPDGETPDNVRTIDAEPLTEEQVERELLNATIGATSIGADDPDAPLRISLAGAQEKTALLLHENQWCRPRGATPSTHIFKLPFGLVGARQADMQTSIENEWLCMQLLGAYGLPVPRCAMLRFGGQKALVVERFDRRLSNNGGYWFRLPQEDCCQALGLPPTSKYESDGGPGIPDIGRLLARSETAADDVRTFLHAQLLFWMMAACDGHAKNFSLRLLPGGKYRLTPLYDVLSFWPIVGNGAGKIHPGKLVLAMAQRGKNKHYRIAGIQRRHFISTAQLCGLGGDAMNAIIDQTVAQTPQVIADMGARLPKGFPLQVFDAVQSGLMNAADQLASEKIEGHQGKP